MFERQPAENNDDLAEKERQAVDDYIRRKQEAIAKGEPIPPLPEDFIQDPNEILSMQAHHSRRRPRKPLQPETIKAPRGLRPIADSPLHIAAAKKHQSDWEKLMTETGRDPQEE